MSNLEFMNDYCEHLFYGNEGSQELLVFLPSANNSGVYPYYPRISWGEELSKKYNVLYISDPYQNNPLYDVSMGSWFISPMGSSTVGELAKRINILIDEFSIKKILFYGSSLGGYAALMLASLISGARVIAECPQLYLGKHPGSKVVCETILCAETDVKSIEPLDYLIKGMQGKVRIICSIFDWHYKQHIVPFLESIRSQELNIDLCVKLYSDHSYAKGHVALNKLHSFLEIEDIMKD